MHLIKNIYFLLFALCLLSLQSQAQDSLQLRFFEPAPHFHTKRFWSTAATGAAIYSSVTIGLNEVWYKDFPRTKFHLFDDTEEWNQMDKMGHTFTAYFETAWCFRGARWTGLERRKSMWLAAGLGTLFQASVEVLDGFSTEWGFSIADIGFNTLGVGAFVGQEILWQEQRIIFKVSSSNVRYPDTEISSKDGGSSYLLSQRATELYGGSYAASFLKDYNAMTIWASFNINAFAKNRLNAKFPRWLNLAVGYGAGNMYGGFANEWEADGIQYRIPDGQYPRYRQFYLSPDIDFTRLPVKKPFLQMIFGLLNVFKMPAPAIEFNTLGKARWHWIHF